MVEKSQFLAQRARCAYISAVKRLNLSFVLSFASQVVESDTNSTKLLNKQIKYAKEILDKFLCFVHLDQNSVRLEVFSIHQLCIEQ